MCYREGGFAYVYLIYGKFHQFAIVVNKKDVPDVVFIRAVIPDEGIEIMRENFGRSVKNVSDLTKSPGNLCKSFGIDLSLYGADLTGDTVWLEDRGEHIALKGVKSFPRIGIDPKLNGSTHQYRWVIG